MNTLDDAWRWYQAARSLCGLTGDLASYWDALPWDDMRPPPERLKRLDAAKLRTTRDAVRSRLDDLAVLVLFSVFESIIRQQVLDQTRDEAEAVRHPILKAAVSDARGAVEQGSFFRVLEPYKGRGVPADVIEGVNQVRRYRNWVAHGCRPLGPEEQLAAVDPESAYARLVAFLSACGPPPAPVPEAEGGDSV